MTLPAADSGPVNRMLPLLDSPYVRRAPVQEPAATCRLCGAKNVPISRDDKRLFVHRIRHDATEPFCPDPGLYASDVAMWESRQLRKW